MEWIVLQPTGSLSTGGATLRVLSDRSILAEGPNPENDSYTIVAQTDLKTITGLRFDVLSDPSLPGGGPGRDGDGSFVLSRIEAQVSPKGAPQTVQPVTWTRAAAEQTAPAFSVESLIESKTSTGWSIEKPKAGKLDRVSAFFEAAGGAGFEQGTALTITLSNRSKKKTANLGRFRLSVTSHERPSLVARLSSRHSGSGSRPAQRRSEVSVGSLLPVDRAPAWRTSQTHRRFA